MTGSAQPFADAEAVARGVQNAELLAVEGAGHVALLSHLDEARETAARYLAA